VSNKAPDPETRTALQRHVDFFDTNHDGRITVSETYSGLRRLGFDITRSLVFAAVINGGLGPSTSRKLSLTIETERIHLGKHGSDSGVYDGRGHFSAQRFAALFSGLEPGAEGGLDAHQLRRMIARNRTDVVGHLASRVESPDPRPEPTAAKACARPCRGGALATRCGVAGLQRILHRWSKVDSECSTLMGDGCCHL